jgi:pyruvate formate lyase activating enzyme
MFLKGCPLHCPWCSNPESINPAIQIKTSPEKCRGCRKCSDICVSGALSRDNGKVRFENILCTDCLACADVCESGCITKIGALISADEAIDNLLRDRPFYNNTNGGVTISGGEPLSQHEFVSEILSRLHKQGVHTALDTSGFAGPEAFAGIIDNVDLFLFDMKHLDREKHQSTIGVYNDIILNNLKECAARTQVWTRTPLIPGFNDDLDITDAIVDLARVVGAEGDVDPPAREPREGLHGVALAQHDQGAVDQGGSGSGEEFLVFVVGVPDPAVAGQEDAVR